MTLNPRGLNRDGKTGPLLAIAQEQPHGLA
jgi:hypothetical protein